MIYRSLALIILLGFLCVCTSNAGQYSQSPGQSGEEILDEILIGEDVLIVKTGSSGCTGKNSFRIDIKKEQGLGPKMPHYVLTIIRVKPDQCKAIVEDGVLVSWDLRKDLDLKENFTYSVKNMVYSVMSGRAFRTESEKSLVDILKKHLTPSGAGQKKRQDQQP